MFTFTAQSSVKLSKEILANSTLKFSEVQKLIKGKDVKVNGSRVSTDLTLSIGDEVVVYALTSKKSTSDYLSVIFEDENVLVVDKKRGVNSDKVFELLREERGELYYIHRLDLNTDGVMIFAKNTASETELLKGFKDRIFKKIYLALVYGKPSKSQAVLTDYLVKDKSRSLVKIFSKKVGGSVEIKTKYSTLKSGEKTSLLKVELLTGRTHQIRAHLASVGHFILGDGKYGDLSLSKSLGVNKQQLTSHTLTLYFDENSSLYYLNNKTFTASREYAVI